MSNFFIKFNRTKCESAYKSPDLCEKIGDFGLAIWRTAFGKTVTVTPNPLVLEGKHLDVIKSNQEPLLKRITAIVLIILTLPISVCLGAIGLISAKTSLSYQEISFAHELFLKKTLQKEIKSDEGLKEHLTASGTPQIRGIPPLSVMDTLVRQKSGYSSAHGQGILYQDTEILEKLLVVREEAIDSSKIKAKFTAYNKPIIQQQATRGCTAAVVEMLIMEHGKPVSLENLILTNLGDHKSMVSRLKRAGLNPLEIEIKDDNPLSVLRQHLLENGSCIASILDSLGGHVVVVDHISKDLSKVRIREPYHGWEITISGKRFLKGWRSYRIIQIQK